MSLLSFSWSLREQTFSAFITDTLVNFWQQRQEGIFLGVNHLPIHFVRFTSTDHQRVIMLIPGRIESYMKYPEVIYDLFHSGYDVVVIDHRGQGKSGRLLPDPHLGHVDRFEDYVDDLEQLWRQEISPAPYCQRFALGHSMGGAILALFLARQPSDVDAAVLCAPMTGIQLPLPQWLVKSILNWIERSPKKREYYALGSRRWRPRTFILNELTHSQMRYQRFLRYYTDYPMLQIGGPSYHWVRESLYAAEQTINNATKINVPLLLLQASDERIVSNASHFVFCQALTQAGNPPYGGEPYVIQGARHEILFEQDAVRTNALEAILNFYTLHF